MTNQRTDPFLTIPQMEKRHEDEIRAQEAYELLTRLALWASIVVMVFLIGSLLAWLF